MHGRSRLFSLAFALFLAWTWDVHAIEFQDLIRKQQAQERARTMVAEMVSAILETQIRQLRENGLTHLAVYQDCTAMRATLSDLVEHEMADVVSVLIELQSAPASEQGQTYAKARASIRGIVTTLLSERQRLNRRMQVSRMAGQVRQILEKQTNVREATLLLPETADVDRDRAALRASHDQADVASLFQVLLANLQDISTWSGAAGTDGAFGLKILRATNADLELRRAAEQIGQAAYAEAARHQFAVAKSLKLLLERLEKQQGPSSEDRDYVLAKVQELHGKQLELQKQTKQPMSNVLTTEDRAERQAAIHTQLVNVEERIPANFRVGSLVEDAKAAALSASASILEDRKEQTYSSQSKVLASLSQIELALKREIRDSDQVSSDQLSEQQSQLAELASRLQWMVGQQVALEDTLESDPRGTARTERKLADEVAHLAESLLLPSTVDSRLAEASLHLSEAAQELLPPASKDLGKSNPNAPNLDPIYPNVSNPDDSGVTNSGVDRKRQVMKRATQSLKQAAEQSVAELSDVRRRQLGLRAGELSRASEVLERVASAERALATQIAGHDSANTKPTQNSSDLRAKQTDKDRRMMESIIRAAASGVRSAAPGVSQELEKLTPMTDGISRDDKWEEASKLSMDAAQRLEKAASDLRRKAGQAARELSQVAQEQLNKLGTVQDAFQSQLSDLEPAQENSTPVSDPLRAAHHKIEVASAEQARAAGNIRLAQLLRVQQLYSQLSRLQQQAHNRTTEFEQGRGNGPLEAIAAQQAVADLAAQPASLAFAARHNEINSIADQTKVAARELMLGNLHKARQAHTAAEHLITNATKLLSQDIESAGDESAGNNSVGAPDGDAQLEVSKLIREASQLCAPEAPKTQTKLDACFKLSQRAETLIREKRFDDTRQVQRQNATKLWEALREIDVAILEQTKQVQRGIVERAERAEELVPDTALVAPDAAAALRQASSVTESMPAHEEPQSAEFSSAQMKFTEQEFNRNLERAAASLSLRELRLRRDRELAESLAQLASEQQVARDELAKHAEMLANPNRAFDAEMEQDAAAGLNEAAQKFAETLREAGEGASELSGQKEIANKALREALEQASKLTTHHENFMEESETSPESSADPSGIAQDQDSGKNSADNGQSGKTDPANPMGNQGSQAEPDDLSGDLGTGLVPNSPESTARQIAGRDAMARAAQIEKADDAMDAAANEEATQGQAKPSRGRPSTTSANGGSSVPGETPKNPSQTMSDPNLRPQTSTDSRSNKDGPAEPFTAPKYASEPWFAKLPASLRSALESNSRRQPPRGYEERLKRYFQSAN